MLVGAIQLKLHRCWGSFVGYIQWINAVPKSEKEYTADTTFPTMHYAHNVKTISFW